MTSQGQRLAQVQLDGYVAIDKIYAPLSIAVADAIMRRATPDAHGILRLSQPARFAILQDVARLLDQARPELFTAILGAVKEAEAAAQVDVDPLPRDPLSALAVYATVPSSLQRNRANVVSQTGALLVKGIVAGGLASRVAKTVKEYFFKRDPATGIVHFWPGRASQASQHARLVMLTETTAAHSRSMILIARRDNLGVKYHVSPKHQHADQCSDNARRDNGWGPGVYRANDAPRVPVHPRCRCHYSTTSLATR